MRAVLLVGYGSVLPGIGTAMIRLAARISAAGIAPIAAAGFIAGCRPTFNEALESCIACGATDIVVQPYALVEDTPIRRDLRRLVNIGRAAHPNVLLRVTRPFGDHPAIAQVVMQRATEVDYARSHGVEHLPLMNAHEHNVSRPPANLYARRQDGKGFEVAQDRWRPLFIDHTTGLVLVAHGSSKPSWDWPVSAAAEWIRINARYTAVGVGFTDGNRPSLDLVIDQMAERVRYLILSPFMLQLTANDTDLLTNAAQAGEQRHPGLNILISDHLNYDRRLLQAIGDRVAEAATPRRQAS